MTINQSAEGLKEVNSRVIDIYLVVSNSYILLGTLPLDQQWYTVLNLKDIFFSLPLTHRSQPYFHWNGRTLRLGSMRN